MKKGFTFLIYAEIRKIMSNIFVIIIAGLLVAASFAMPFISKAQEEMRAKRRMKDRQTVVVEGQEISGESPFYNGIIDLDETKTTLEANAKTKADDAALELVEELLEVSLISAKYVKSYDDYRSHISWQKRDAIIDRYIFSNLDSYSLADISLILSYVGWGMDEATVIMLYFDLDESERAQRIEAANKQLAMLNQVEANNDYNVYYRYQIYEAEKNIETLELEIKVLENDIFESPQNEELYSGQIENKKSNIELKKEIDIVLLEYRLENEISPFFADWRDSAVSDKRNALYDVSNGEPMSEEEFENAEYYRRTYITYRAYIIDKQGIVNEATKKLLIADLSLESGKPDMKYVLDGARIKTTNFLWYSIVISLFAIIIGGGLMSKEFKDGTIRLLLIRPKNRIKIVLSKMVALILICFTIYFASAALNILANGLIYGFADYAYPNYTMASGAGEISFFTDYAAKFFVCFLSIMFLATFSVFLSVTTKNTAVSAAVPIVIVLASLIFMVYFLSGNANQRSLKWVFDTPFPYVNMFMYCINVGFWWEFEVSKALGAIYLGGLTVVMGFAGTMSFKKSDIKN